MHDIFIAIGNNIGGVILSIALFALLVYGFVIPHNKQGGGKNSSGGGSAQ